MPTYDYEVISTGAVVETQQRMSEPAHTHRDPHTGEWHTMTCDAQEVSAQLPAAWRVRRLISGAPAVQFISGPSGGWSDSGYALTPAQRKAEMKLGRKVTRRA